MVEAVKLLKSAKSARSKDSFPSVTYTVLLNSRIGKLAKIVGFEDCGADSLYDAVNELAAAKSETDEEYEAKRNCIMQFLETSKALRAWRQNKRPEDEKAKLQERLDDLDAAISDALDNWAE